MSKEDKASEWFTVDQLESEMLIDPEKTNLAHLLNIADSMAKGLLVLRGEMDSGEVQWGAVIVYGQFSESLMKKIEAVLQDDMVTITHAPAPPPSDGETN
jgi:hypothetical protein